MSDTAIRPTENGKAALMMVLGMSAFAVADSLIRLASLAPGGGATAGQILMLHGVFGTLLFGGWMLFTGRLPGSDLLRDRNVIARTLSDGLAAGCFITALTLMPVGQASAILQFQPLVVTLGAVIFLGEKVGPFRWGAILVGFIGVMIIMRPGMDDFDPAALLVLVAVLGLAGRDLLTRVTSLRHSTMALTVIVSFLLIWVGLALQLALWGADGMFELGSEAFAYTALSTVFALAGYFILTMALRIGEISFIAPYRYSRLVAAFLAAWLLLGERPDAVTVAGGLVVVLSGLFVIYRERGSRRRAGRPQAS